MTQTFRSDMYKMYISRITCIPHKYIHGRIIIINLSGILLDQAVSIVVTVPIDVFKEGIQVLLLILRRYFFDKSIEKSI